MKNNNPIFITGIERSGSSIVAKILRHCGVFSGTISEMEENIYLKEMLSIYYNNLGVDPRGQFPLPNTKPLFYPSCWREVITAELELDGYTHNCPWMYKSPRIGQTWQMWHKTFPEARWILVRRRTADIIHSCIKTGFMSAFKTECNLFEINAKTEAEGWMWWVHEQEKSFIEMESTIPNLKIVWPERMAAGDFEQMKEIVDWLELPWNEEISNIIYPLFENSKQKK